ncbi:MAG: sigma-70 family RNA polymerase sigma factor [Bacillota bacterium]
MADLKPFDGNEIKSLFERFARRVFEAAYFVLQDRTMAEDVMQETFLTAMTKLRNPQDPLKIEAWLIRVAMNKARSELRKRKKKIPLLFPVVANLTEEGFITKEEKKQVQVAVEALPAKYQLVLYLMYHRNMTTKQIAQALDLPEGTVKSRLRRAYKLMKPWLE